MPELSEKFDDLKEKVYEIKSDLKRLLEIHDKCTWIEVRLLIMQNIEKIEKSQTKLETDFENIKEELFRYLIKIEGKLSNLEGKIAIYSIIIGLILSAIVASFKLATSGK